VIAPDNVRHELAFTSKDWRGGQNDRRTNERGPAEEFGGHANTTSFARRSLREKSTPLAPQSKKRPRGLGAGVFFGDSVDGHCTPAVLKRWRDQPGSIAPPPRGQLSRLTTTTGSGIINANDTFSSIAKCVPKDCADVEEKKSGPPFDEPLSCFVVATSLWDVRESN
jgi:hypothetical protein